VLDRIHTGDRILVSGSVGDHGTAVPLAREQFGLRGDLRSDASSVLPLTQASAAIDGQRVLDELEDDSLPRIC
jgi:hydrogenase expression/formation protein HypE